ncbi:MAG: DUF6049 family protein [Acidimicrobiales bacterium]
MLALGALLLGPSGMIGPVARSAAAAPPPNGSLNLVYQTPSVGASGDFTMRLRVERPPAPSDPEVAITVYPTVATRSEFALTLADRIERDPLLPVQTFPLSSTSPDAAGEMTIVLRFADRLSLGRTEGVFPMRVDLRERARPSSRSGTEPPGRSGTEPGRVLQRFVTHVVYVPVQPTGAKLGVALVLPVHAPPGLPADGPRQRQDLDHLAAVPAGLDALRGTPVALAPTPETLTTLASDTDDKAVAVVKALQQRAPATTVLSGTYVPTDLPALLAAKLDVDAATQVTRGTNAAADALRVRPDPRTWWGPGPLDEAALALLGGRGVERVVVGEADLIPVTSQRLTLTQPFMLSAGTRKVPALAADAGLAAYFDSRTPPVLGANHLLADLAVIYLDRPGDDGRGVVAMAPPTWRVDRQFLETAASGWNQNPMVEPKSLDALFGAMAAPTDDDGGPPVRTAATPPAGGLSQLAPELRDARRRLDALATVLGPGSADHAILDERLLLAESSDLGSNGRRQEYVDAVLSGIDDQREDIRMPGGRSITLTARAAEIPVTFQNLTGAPAKVVVRMQSDKLDFPQGNVQMLDLTRRNTTERFSVVSRTSGAFPLRITLESPDGNLVIGQARMTVRSAAASSISLIVSIGAAVFLAIWWGRHALRGRRARRLVPT